MVVGVKVVRCVGLGVSVGGGVGFDEGRAVAVGSLAVVVLELLLLFELE